MKKRKSYFTNFSTSHLFVLMKQSKQELDSVETKLTVKPNLLLVQRKKELQLVLGVSKNEIIKRYLEENISLTKIAKLLTASDGVELSVYKELFTLKVLETDEMISLDLLENAIDKLELSDLMMIIRTKKNTIYEKMAIKKYDEMIFNVEPEVYKEYVLKKVLDGKR